MGKFRSKLKGQTKGKRWPKGQSSNSNPETRKYRDQAKSRFFQENLGSSSLTSLALQKHDAVQSFHPMEEDAASTESSASGTYSSYKSIKSFASEWSDCTNVSFNRFLNIFRPDSALHKEMLAVLAAIAEVIKENGGSETPTEYYCSLLTTLEQVYNSEEKNEDQITAVLSLLNMGIRSVPEAVLKSNFSDVSAKMMYILNDYSTLENNNIIKSAIGILGVLLKTQEIAVWTHESTNQILQTILNPFCIHSKPKWRKSAQQAVTAIVKSNSSFEENSSNPAAKKVAEFCEQTLQDCLGGNLSKIPTGQTTILHVLGLMKETISNFPKTHIKKNCEIVLQLMTLNYPVVTSCSLQVLHSLFSSQSIVVPAKLNGQLISALYEYQPATGDVQPTLAWLVVMQQAHIHLSDVDINLSCAALPKFVSILIQLWLSEKVEVLSAATYTLEAILKDAVAPACFTIQLVEQHKSKLHKCFGLVASGLGYQFHSVWHQVLHVIGVMFEVGGLNCKDLLSDCLKSLAELRDSYKFSFNNELEHAVGAAVRSMGPEFVLNVIDLKKPNGDLNLDRSWMLPVLKENIKTATLDYFINGILPLAIYCNKRTMELAQINDGIGAHSSELLYTQLWNLLPCFCNHPIDIKNNFKNIAKILGTAISTKKDLRLPVMASLRKLISYAKEAGNEDDLPELARFDKNYLPILFNVYTTKPIGSDEEGQRLAALDTIKVYLTISKPELIWELFTNAIERLNAQSEDPEDSFIKESILDLIRALVPYQTPENIAILYNQCVKCLPEIKNNKEQKKAYRILEEICGSNSESCQNFVGNNRKEVQRLLMKSLDIAAVSSKGARLRCLNYLIKAQPNLDYESKLIRSVIPETVLSCKDINEKTRSIAYNLLNTIGDLMMQHGQMSEFLALVMAGLAGNPQLMSCSILALASILHNFTGGLGPENIRLLIENVAILSTSSTREVVASCLSFIKVYCTTLPSPIIAASLSVIMKSLTGMTEDCKRHFRLKVRDILDKLVRKYGCESITPYIPDSDTIMYKRLRNLRKNNARKKRQKELLKEQNSDSENEEFLVNTKPKSVDEILADSDIEEMETDQAKIVKKKQTNTWIEENSESIIDFTDPNVISKITATKPKENLAGLTVSEKKIKEKDRGFKTASDGRLIITDIDSSDDDKKTKNVLNFSSDDESGDGQSIAETLVLSDRKRKRGSSVKSGLSSLSQPPTKYKTGGVGIHRSTNASSNAPGTEFKAKKAKGDMKKKGKCDPYAYLPLRRNMLNKRKKMKAAGQFKNIVKAAKSGALKGGKTNKK